VLLRATVHHVTGSTAHYLMGEAGPQPMAPAAHVEIVDANGGYSLNRYSAEGVFAGDTWHATLDEAKRQAQVEYAIPPEEWK